MMQKLLSKLADPPAEFRPVSFWFLNHCPEETLLREQIRRMREAGFGGVMLHPRNGLLPCEYLNERWEKTVTVVLDEVKAQGMRLWLYDELHYPSGVAGGRVLDQYPDCPLQYLELIYDGNIPPPDDALHIVEAAGHYLAFQVRTQRQYPDYLDSETMAQFVKNSYHWYAERFGDDFGTAIPGEFTDNACGNFGAFRRSIPWTPALPKLFLEQTGLEFDTILPSLFLDTTEASLHRLLFWRFFNRLFLKSFVIPIEQECARNGIAATGHYCIEDGTSEHVRQLGDRFEQKLHQQIPGVDMLGRHAAEANESFPIGTASAMIGMTASPAYFYHGSRVLCECLGLTQGWGMTLAEAMRMCFTLAALGVDIFVIHGLFYSIAGHRKRECPPDFLHNPMLEFLPILTRRLAQLSLLAAHSRHLAETALFYPLTAQQASMELLEGPGLNHGKKCAEIDNASRRAADSLIQNAIPFEFLNEELIANATVQEDELVLRLPDGGTHHVRTVILPSVWIMEKKTLVKLEKFQRAGGLLVTMGCDVSACFDGKAIQPACLTGQSFDTAIIRQNMRHSRTRLFGTDGKILLREWIKGDEYFVMLQNFSRKSVAGVRVDCGFAPLLLHLDSGEHQRLSETFVHDFAGGETLVLCEAAPRLPVEQPAMPRFREFSLPIAEWKVRMESYNTLIINKLSCMNEGLSRHWEGTFTIKEMPETLFLTMDLEPSEDELRNHQTPFEDGQVTVLVNGVRVEHIMPGRHFDRWMPEADILRLARLGENSISFVQNNIHLLDSSRPVEPPILFGHFGVQDGQIIMPPQTLPFPRWDGTILERYSGALLFEAPIDIPSQLRGHRIRLTLNGVREIAQVFADGRVQTAVKPPFVFEISPECKMLRLRLVNTPSNLWEEPLPSGVTGALVWHYEE